MSKDIKKDLHIENELKEEFFQYYMILTKPEKEIIDMFLDDVDYSQITTSRDDMKAKLQGWAKLYKELNKGKDIPDYAELKEKMKTLMKSYGFDNDDAKNIFISRLLDKGIKEKRAEEIADKLIGEIKEYYNIQL